MIEEEGRDVPKRFGALQHRNFQLFIAGQLVSLIGTWMQSTAQLWLVYKLTNSAALLGVFGFANQIAILLLASVGGYIGDRYNRHLGVIWTQTVSMILAFTLAALTFSHLLKVWHLILIAIVAFFVLTGLVVVAAVGAYLMAAKPIPMRACIVCRLYTRSRW